jgi:hypothetical protein
MSATCGVCKSGRLEEAVVFGAGVQPVRAGRLAKALAAAELRARVCLDCGAVDQFKADVQRLKKMLGEKSK